MAIIMKYFLYLICILFLSPVSNTLEPITTNNAAQLEEIALIGRGTITALDWSPDGQVLAVGSSTGVWLLEENLQTIQDTPVHEPISDLSWSPDGQHIAVISSTRHSCVTYIWNEDLSSRQLVFDICGSYVLWSSDSVHLAIFNSALMNNRVQLVNAVTGEIRSLPGQSGAWSPSGNILFTRLNRILTYTDSPIIYSWDANTQEQLFALEVATDQYLPIFEGLSNRTLAVLCTKTNELDSKIYVGLCSLDTYTGAITRLQEIDTFEIGQCSCVSNLAWNDDDSLFAYVHRQSTPGFSNPIIVRNSQTNEINQLGYGDVFDWKPNSDFIAVGSDNGEIQIYDAQTSNFTAESDFFTAPINTIAINPSNNEIATASFGYDQKTQIWDFEESLIEPRLSLNIDPTQLVAYSANGDELIAGGTITTDIVAYQNVAAFDSETGEMIRNIESFYGQGSSPPQRYWNADYTRYAEVNPEGNIVLPNGIIIPSKMDLEYVSWSSDESKIAIVEHYPNDYSFNVHTWDAVTGEKINYFSSGMFAFRGLVWSPDSKQIAVLLEHPTGGNIYVRGLRVFSVLANQNYTFDYNDYEVFEDVRMDEIEQQVKVDWNSKGTMLAVAMPTTLQIHLLTGDGTPLTVLPAGNIVDLHWSADDTFIAGGSNDGTIHLWVVPQN